MKLIVGLGNPGAKYEMTKHNMGFLAIDSFLHKMNVEAKKIKFKSLYAEVMFCGEKIILVKPQTFMNRSGDAVREWVNFYKVEKKDILIIYDDVDLEFAKVRLRKQGSAGTHNGMRDIVYKLGFDDFSRLRLGIGRNREIPIVNEVLTTFNKDEIKELKKLFVKTNDVIESFIEYGPDLTMSRYNG